MMGMDGRKGWTQSRDVTTLARKEAEDFVLTFYFNTKSFEQRAFHSIHCPRYFAGHSYIIH